MRHPQRYTAKEIKTWMEAEEYEPGQWRPSRHCALKPVDWWHWQWLRRRIVFAWRVFTGRADIVEWGDHSGEWSADHIKFGTYAPTHVREETRK